MPYTRAQNWVDGYDGRTPITAAALNHIEDGLAAATATADGAATAEALAAVKATADGAATAEALAAVKATADGAATAEALAAVRTTATSAQQTADAALPKAGVRTVSWVPDASAYTAAGWVNLSMTVPSPLVQVNANTFRVPASALGAVIMLSTVFSSGGGGTTSQQILEARFGGADQGPGGGVIGARTSAFNADRPTLVFVGIPGSEYSFWIRHQTGAGTATHLCRAFLL
ncbi:hypothetical protein [Actinomyces ruminis]|uniref:Minor tail protein n=1 Tax=Actinomyces ruminis TaxID=1937003 RepID=A0ABX4MAU6_9ACTO|nr:hypothetical protein [Actinomyces ruminis]PHP52600.1 hypothetical protein BW737_008955 [Actinomyces ruminis]